jgi:hypothetical protein
MFSILLGSMQVLGQLFNLFTNQIPAQLRNLLKYLSVLNFNVVQFMSVTCMINALSIGVSNINGFYVGFLFKAALPFMVVGLFGLVFYICGKNIMKAKAQKAEMEAKKEFSEEEMEEVDKKIMVNSQYKTAAVVTGIFLVNLIHPSVSTAMFEIYNCNAIYWNDTDLATKPNWMSADYSVECFAGAYWLYAGISMSMIFLFVFGWPFAVLQVRKQFPE